LATTTDSSLEAPGFKEKDMTNIHKNFKQFLAEAPRESYIKDGMIQLYHYTKPDKETIVLDPEYQKSYYSRNEFEIATTPRTFFYVDPSQKESFFGISNLYTTQVPASQVYNLSLDPKGFKDKIRHPVYGLRKGEEWDELMETIREEFGGIFYSTSNFDVVAWFYPIEVERVPNDEKDRLERTER
jgi:hypothetical protein